MTVTPGSVGRTLEVDFVESKVRSKRVWTWQCSISLLLLHLLWGLNFCECIVTDLNEVLHGSLA